LAAAGEKVVDLMADLVWPVEREGSRNENVRSIQYLLGAHGIPVAVDKIFGPQTAGGVRQFQGGEGLTADGVVGPLTWPELIIQVSRGSKGPAVRAVQQQLNARTSSLAVDGDFGPQTELAVRGFQQASGLVADAIVGPLTWNALVRPPVVATAPVRRNVAKVPKAERDKLRDAIVELDRRHPWADGVSEWDKQDEIHQATHVHGGPAFIPWHRELVNRFEAMLQEVDPTVALHYWDWQTDPRSSADGSGGTVDLFATGPDGFMGSSTGRAGAPLDGLDNGDVFAGSRDQTGNPVDPPQAITRDVSPGAPPVPSDAVLLAAGDGLPEAEQWNAVREAIEGAHNDAHTYIGGNIGDPHASFEDPFVYLLHANVDRLWAKWQRVPGQEWRLDPTRVYGNETPDLRLQDPLQPWAGGTPTRPWAAPESLSEPKACTHPTIVTPARYED